jgi:hypothetical protein
VTASFLLFPRFLGFFPGAGAVAGILGACAGFGLWSVFYRYVEREGPVWKAKALGEQPDQVRQQFPWKVAVFVEERTVFSLYALSDPDPRYQYIRDKFIGGEEGEDQAGYYAPHFEKYLDRERLEGMLEFATDPDYVEAAVRVLGTVGTRETAAKLRSVYGQPKWTPNVKIAILNTVLRLEGPAARGFLKTASEADFGSEVGRHAYELAQNLSKAG